MIDLRHHIITLVAVFLALAVGMAVGSSFLAGTSIEKQVSRLLEKEFGKLRAENERNEEQIAGLSTQLDKQSRFDEAIAPMLVAGRLAGRRVAIIQTGDYGEATEDVKEILETAGAKVASVTVLLGSKWSDVDDNASSLLQSMTGETNADDPSTRIIEALVYSIVTGTNPHAVDVLENSGAVTQDGDYSSHVSVLVLVGGSEDKDVALSQEFDSAMLDQVKSLDFLTSVGVEPSYAVGSYIPVYRDKAITTVDNIDQAMGQVSLVFGILGESGNYGVKSTADKVFPDSLEKGAWAQKSQ